MNKDRYIKRAEEIAPKSKTPQNLAMAFLVGGAICGLGQVCYLLFLRMGASYKNAAAYCSVSLIFLSIVLTFFRVYDRIAKYAGAGTLVPITGFANAASSAAMEFKTEGFILGVGAKIFNICGPVIVYGNLAASIYGVGVWIWEMVMR